jgi:hypothetical protein
VTSTDPAFSGALLRYSDANLTGALRAIADAVTLALSAASFDDGLIVDLTLNGFTQSFGTLGAGVKTVELDGLDGADTFTLDDVLPIEITIAGGDGSDTLAGPADGTEWEVTGAGLGTFTGFASFTGIENLAGGTGDDRFNVRDGGTISGQIDGGTGAGTGDELIGPDADSTWTFAGAGAGALGTTDFVGIENVTGGDRADHFQVSPAGELSGLLDGGLDKAVVRGRHGGRPPTRSTIRASRSDVDLALDLALRDRGPVIERALAHRLFVGSAADGDTWPAPTGRTWWRHRATATHPRHGHQDPGRGRQDLPVHRPNVPATATRGRRATSPSTSRRSLLPTPPSGSRSTSTSPWTITGAGRARSRAPPSAASRT